MSSLTLEQRRGLIHSEIVQPLAAKLAALKNTKPFTDRIKSGVTTFRCELCEAAYDYHEPNFQANFVQAQCGTIICLACRDRTAAMADVQFVDEALAAARRKRIVNDKPRRVVPLKTCCVCLREDTATAPVVVSEIGVGAQMCVDGCESQLTGPIKSTIVVFSVHQAAKIRTENPAAFVAVAENRHSRATMLRLFQVKGDEEKSIYKEISSDLDYVRANYKVVDVVSQDVVFARREEVKTN